MWNQYLKLTLSIRDKNSAPEQQNFFLETIHINEESLQEFLVDIKHSIHMIDERNETNHSINSEREQTRTNDICIFAKKYGTHTF